MRVLGITVCEDLWVAGRARERGGRAPAAKLIVNISASPYHAGKGAERERLFAERAREHGAHVAFCGMVGGQDELVFDGHSPASCSTHPKARRSRKRPRSSAEDLLVCDLGASLGEDAEVVTPSSAAAPRYRPLHTPIVLARGRGLRRAVAWAPARLRREERLRQGVVLGLSGGIDSALVACLAVDALGAERVNVAVMPSSYSSRGDPGRRARALAARALGVRSARARRSEPRDGRVHRQTLHAGLRAASRARKT